MAASQMQSTCTCNGRSGAAPQALRRGGSSYSYPRFRCCDSYPRHERVLLHAMTRALIRAAQAEMCACAVAVRETVVGRHPLLAAIAKAAPDLGDRLLQVHHLRQGVSRVPVQMWQGQA